MHTLADKFQFQAQAIKRGNHKLAIVHQEIIDWITNQFGTRALDFFCETRATPKGLPQQLVHVMLETGEDVKRIQANRAAHAVITERFKQYFKSGTTPDATRDPLKSNVFPMETNPYPEIIVTYRFLKEINGEIVKEMQDDEKRSILETFESVWTISQTVVFYYTDVQMKENMANGTSIKISEALAQTDKKYGLDESLLYQFDSKESFDRDYNGQWHDYWK